MSCSSITKSVKAAPPHLAVSVIAIAPLRLTGTSPQEWRSFELTQRQMNVALQQCGTRLAFFGPSEVQISRWDEPGWLGNNAVPVITRHPIPLEQVLLLRTTAEQRVATATQEREDAKGRHKAGAVVQETTWLLTLELIHPSSRQTLAELNAQVTVDPFEKPTDESEFDPAPTFTHLLESMTREAMDIAQQWSLERPAAPQSALMLALSPAVTASFPDAALGELDALQAELWLQARARFLSPWLTDAQAAKLAHFPVSLWITDAKGDDGVIAGDLILSIDGEKPLPEVLARKRLKGVPVEVRISRNGNERDAVVR